MTLSFMGAYGGTMARPLRYADRFHVEPKLDGPFTVNWEDLSTILGKELEPDMKVTIIAAIGLYIFVAHTRSGAVPIKKLAKSLRRLYRAAERVREMLSADTPFVIPSSKKSRYVHGRAMLNSIIETYFQGGLEPVKRAREYENYVFWILLHTVEAMTAVSNWVEREITDPKFPAYTKSMAWEFWIQMLTQAMKIYGLPHKVNKSTRKPGIDPSPFVLFVQKLQKGLPKEFRRYNNFDKNATGQQNVLAQAIVRARRHTEANSEAMEMFELFVKPTQEKAERVTKLFRLRRAGTA
jgi:hypothetical protein